jgi:hypothetical protein
MNREGGGHMAYALIDDVIAENVELRKERAQLHSLISSNCSHSHEELVEKYRSLLQDQTELSLDHRIIKAHNVEQAEKLKALEQKLKLQTAELENAKADLLQLLPLRMKIRNLECKNDELNQSCRELSDRVDEFDHINKNLLDENSRYQIEFTHRTQFEMNLQREHEDLQRRYQGKSYKP